MHAAIFHAPRRVEAGEPPDPALRKPTDAIVRVVLACVCGSDLLIAPFGSCDNTCPHCRHGVTSACERRLLPGQPCGRLRRRAARQHRGRRR